MELLRTIKNRSAGAEDFALLDNWTKNKGAEVIALDVAMPVTVATPGTPAIADLNAVLSYFIGKANLAYGPGQEFKPWEGVDGVDLRLISRVLTLREVWSDFIGVAQTAGAKTWRARIYLPTFPVHMTTRTRRARRIGSAQGRTMKVTIQEGATLAAGALGITRTAGVDCTVEVRVQYVPAPPRQTWCPLPSFRKIDRAQSDVVGPDGTMLLVADANAASGATAIGTHSLRLGGHDYIVQSVPRYAAAAYSRALDAGATDVTDSITVLYAAEPGGDLDSSPAGAPSLSLLAQDVATVRLRCVYLPDIGAGDEIATAERVVAAAVGTPVNASVPDLPEGSARGAQATSPLEFYGPDDSRYYATPGHIVRPSGEVHLYVPDTATRAASSALAAAHPKARESVAKLVQKRLALRVPGATATDGSGRGGPLGREGVRGALSGLFT